ncbi:MAG TPA: tripartite tricarboxylate transporter substrate binding protein [Roseomonas sp.]
MIVSRRAVLALPAVLASPRLARAGDWPDHAIRFVVPFTPGGSTDLLARMVATPLAAALGQPVVVENRPSAGGTVASALVATAPPDGYSILMGHTGTLSVNASLYQLSYDPNGFASISRIALVPNVLVVNPRKIQAGTIQEFLAYAKANPNSITFGSGGNGGVAHIAMAALAHATGINLVHVPYRGTGPMLVDLLAGQIDMTMTGVPPLLEHIRGGKLRALGVSSLHRVDALPEVAPIAEIGVPGFEAVQWQGVVAPGGTPAPIVARLNREIRRALTLPAVLQRLAEDGAEPAPSTPEEFAAQIRSEIGRWGELVRATNMRPD